MRMGIAETLQSDQIEDLVRARMTFASRNRGARCFKAELGIRTRSAPGQQPVLLEHIRERVAFVVLRPPGPLAVDPELALTRFEQPRHHVEQRALAASRRAEQRHYFTLRDIEGNVIQNFLDSEVLSHAA